MDDFEEHAKWNDKIIRVIHWTNMVLLIFGLLASFSLFIAQGTGWFEYIVGTFFLLCFLGFGWAIHVRHKDYKQWYKKKMEECQNG